MSLPAIALGTVALAAIWAIYTYNFMIHARAKVREARSGVDVQLRLRHDLVPALNAVVREYAEHEHDAMRVVAACRSKAIGAGGTPYMEPAENSLAAGLSELLALAEQYPNLKASTQFRAVAEELAAIENELQAARSLHNQNVEYYNSRAQSLPALLVAGFMRPSRFAYLRLDPVDFDSVEAAVGEFAA